MVKKWNRENYRIWTYAENRFLKNVLKKTNNEMKSGEIFDLLKKKFPKVKYNYPQVGVKITRLRKEMDFKRKWKKKKKS